MKKLIIIIAIFMAGCSISTNAIKSQRIDIPKGHSFIIHKSRVEMENAYALVWAGSKDRTGEKARGKYTGFFDHSTNTSHCFAPWAYDCLAHENIHLLVKYGLEIDDAHFKPRRKFRTIVLRKGQSMKIKLIKRKEGKADNGN